MSAANARRLVEEALGFAREAYAQFLLAEPHAKTARCLEAVLRSAWWATPSERNLQESTCAEAVKTSVVAAFRVSGAISGPEQLRFLRSVGTGIRGDNRAEALLEAFDADGILAAFHRVADKAGLSGHERLEVLLLDAARGRSEPTEKTTAPWFFRRGGFQAGSIGGAWAAWAKGVFRSKGGAPP